jgi:pentapeptide MXKDX repeat protein
MPTGPRALHLRNVSKKVALKGQINQKELEMRKTILAAMCATAIAATPFAAFAQTTGPAGQDSTKMGTDTNMGSGMSKSGTQGMSKSSMKKTSMHKSSMKKSGMMKDDMKK